MTNERDELEKIFHVAESLENQKRDEEKTKKLLELIQEKGRSSNCLFHLHRIFSIEDEIQNGIQREKELSTELDVKLREWEKKLRQKQTEIGGANAADTFNANVRKQERVLENRLDTVGNICSIECQAQFFSFSRL